MEKTLYEVIDEWLEEAETWAKINGLERLAEEQHQEQAVRQRCWHIEIEEAGKTYGGYQLGRTYLDHYWQESHTIIGVHGAPDGEWYVTSYWHRDKRTTTHFTALDPRDKDITDQPAYADLGEFLKAYQVASHEVKDEVRQYMTNLVGS